MATYNAYAASLLTDHGLRIGHEPDTRVHLRRRRATSSAARVVDRHTRRRCAFLTDHPRHVIQYLLALDGAMSEHLVGARRRPARFDAEAERAFLREDDAERAGKAARPTSRPARRSTRSSDDASCWSWSSSYRRLKRDLGLMDFSDQIALGARLAVEQPDVGAVEREQVPRRAARRVPGHLGRAGHHARRGSSPASGHAVTAVGDPNQAIYGWRGASVSNILQLRRHLPARADGRVAGVPPHGQPALRPPDPRGRQPARRAALRAYAGQVVRWPPQPDAGEGVVTARVHETHGRRARPGSPDEVAPAHDARRRRGADIGVLTRDNAHAAEVFDALTARDVPVEIVGLGGLIRLPEVAEVVATLAPAPRPDRERRAAHAADRPALGDRAARPRAARPPGAPRWPGGRPARGRARSATS